MVITLNNIVYRVVEITSNHYLVVPEYLYSRWLDSKDLNKTLVINFSAFKNFTPSIPEVK